MTTSNLATTQPGRAVPRLGHDNDQPSMTKQSFKDESDINVIMRRFQRDGVLPLPKAEPRWEDFTSVDDYHASMNTVKAAEAAFADLPAYIRHAMGNSAENLLEFLSDEENREEAIELGLIPAESKSMPKVGDEAEPPADPPPESAEKEGGTPAV